MFFFHSRPLNGSVPFIAVHGQAYTNNLGHTCLVVSCLAVIAGMTLIVFGVILERVNTKLIGIGIISLGLGFVLMTLVCFYAKLFIWYNNWAYRTRVLPMNVVASPYVEPSRISLAPANPLTRVSKLIVAPTINIGPITTMNNPDTPA